MNTKQMVQIPYDIVAAAREDQHPWVITVWHELASIAKSTGGYDPQYWWHPFRTFSIGTCVFQWGALITLLALFNRPIRRALFNGGGAGITGDRPKTGGDAS